MIKNIRTSVANVQQTAHIELDSRVILSVERSKTWPRGKNPIENQDFSHMTTDSPQNEKKMSRDLSGLKLEEFYGAATSWEVRL